MTDQGANCFICTKFGPKFLHAAGLGTFWMLPITVKVKTTINDKKYLQWLTITNSNCDS